MKAPKDDGIEESFVSFRQNVRAETEVKLPLGGKDANDSKDCGVEESFVSANKYTS